MRLLCKKQFKFLVLLTLTLVSCGEIESNNIVNTVNSNIGTDYISFTVSKQISDNKIESSVYSYDINNGDIDKKFTFDYSTQYPLGVYEQTTNTVYYTKGNKNTQYISRDNINSKNNGDLIFKINLDTMEEELFVDNTFAVNDIITCQKYIYIIARTYDGENMILEAINKDTQEVKIWNFNDDISVSNCVVDEKNDSIYIVSYSENELRENLKKQTNNDFILPIENIYKTDLEFNNSKVIYSERSNISAILTRGDDEIVALVDLSLIADSGNQELINISLLNDTSVKNTWGHEKLQIGLPNYSEDKNILYSISTLNNKRGIVKWDLINDTKQIVFDQEDGFINNMLVFK